MARRESGNSDRRESDGCGKSENFFGNRNDPNCDERENKTRIYTRPRVSVAL